MYYKVVFFLRQFIKKYCSQIMWMFPRLIYMFYRLVGDKDLLALCQLFVTKFLDFVVFSSVDDYI
jgi:hypothetical protein